MRSISFLLLIWFGVTGNLVAAEPVNENTPLPILRLRPEGTRAAISSLEFSADGRQLFAAGDAKQVDVWTQHDGRFRRDHRASLRSPIGPGPTGVLRAMAVSRNNRFVAVGGIGVFDDLAGFRNNGILIPRSGFDAKTLAQLGSLNWFDRERELTRTIPSHLGYVLAIDLIEPLSGQSTNQDGPLIAVVGNEETPAQCDVIVDNLDRGGSTLSRSLRIIRPGTGETIAKWNLPDSGLQPEISAWMQTPERLETIRVVVTSGNGTDGGLEVFTYGQPDPVRIDDPFAIAVAGPLVDQTWYATTRGGLRRLNVSDARAQTLINLNAQLSPSEFIFELAAPPRRSDDASASSGVLALTTRNLNDPRAGHRLRLLDLATGTLIGPPIELGSRQNPVVAVDPTGQWIAATADVTAGLQIFRIDELRRGNPVPHQSIEGDFVPIRRAALARNANGKTGLRLQRENDGNIERWDLIGGELQRVEVTDWTSFGTPMAFRQVGENAVLDPNWDQGNRNSPWRIPELKTASEPLGVAMRLPFLQDRFIAAIAYVASTGEATPRLILVDLSTGETLRELNGHDQFIGSIEFSRSGRRLTTVSGDGMVCVWALDDLVDLVGRRGSLLETQFCHDGEHLVVTKTDPSGRANIPAQTALRVGDSIIKIVSPSQTDGAGQGGPFQSVYRFLERLSTYPVGSDASLEVLREGKPIEASVRLGQATDERKPLVSVVLAQPSGSDVPAWLAWTPHGPFDASNESIEQRAGWHFNSSRTEIPSRFAPLAEYRDKFFGAGLLDSLLTRGRIPDVWPPALEPEAFGVLRDGQGRDVYADGRHFLLEGGTLTSVQFLIDHLPASSVDSVTVQVDDAAVAPLQRSPEDPNIWQRSINTQLSANQPHRITLTIAGDRIASGTWSDQWQIQVADESSRTEPLPEVRITSHGSRSNILVPSATEQANGDNGYAVSLKATVASESMDPTWQFQMEVDGQPVAADASEVQGNQFSGQVSLPLGRHLVAVVMSDGERRSRSETILIELSDPPTIESIVAELSPSGLGTATVSVRSRRPITADQVEVFVESMRFDGLTVDIQNDAKEATSYHVQIDDIPLSEGTNQIECRIPDVSGHSRPTAGTTLVFHPNLAQPELLVSLADSIAVESASIPVEIQNIGSMPISLRVSVGDRDVPLGDNSRLGVSSASTTVSIPLRYGNNRIKIVATGDQGQRVVRVHDVVRIQPPMNMVIEQVVTADDQTLAVTQNEDGWVCEQSVDHHEVRVRGAIQLPTGGRGDSFVSVQGWVNGFLQNSVAARVNGDDRLVFEIPLRMTATDSTIQFRFPELPEAESKSHQLSVTCARPDTDQTLHVIVVSTEVADTDRKRLEERVRQTFSQDAANQFAFSEVRCGEPHYFAATGQVRSGSIRSLMRRCYLQTNSRSPTNHVVMLYFQGREIRDSSGTFGLVTDDVLDRLLEDRATITSDYLADEFRRIRGAHLVLLDVQPHPLSVRAANASDPNHPELGVLRLIQPEQTADAGPTVLLEQIKKHLPHVQRLVELADAMRQPTPDNRVAFDYSVPENLGQVRLNLTQPLE
ncbi:WD40 repeat domain-containing protein [Neorhodopirellula pilleata]|uniref:WD domain, G-beta repeat n=1 Tax=Neorhodopirellula pilleata TaxID=2714738 RepID=A0A5C5ZPU6_9BACT|nr:WD40 repeat domain-containing protein [Neorhodopirellula pilleata]TWT89504.1 WD domain, G-beta repeat [Neorhodopirellula pilleata]